MTISYSLPKLEEVTIVFTAKVATYNRDKIWDSGKVLKELTLALEQFQRQDNFSIGDIKLTMKADD